jgi:hypothetical protein
MLCRVYKREDGTLAIYHPNPRLRRDGEEETAFVERLASVAATKNSSLDGLAFVDLDTEDLPPDRADRDAWRLEGKKVVVARGRTRRS